MMNLDQPPHVVNLLVFSNHFIRHIMAYVTPDQMAKTVPKFLWQGYISIFRALAKLLSDWTASFKSNIIGDLCELMGIWKARTLPYHPQTNGQVEQAHQMLMWMIGKFGNEISHHQIQPALTDVWVMTAPTHWLLFSHYHEHRKNTSVSITVQSLQGSGSTIHIRGWKAEVILWS